MRITQIIFSPTGGTQRVADILTSGWNFDAIDKVDLSNPKTDYSLFNFEEDDIAVIAVPSFAGRVPTLAAERLAKLDGRKTPCVLICVYGNRAYEDTLIELHDLANQSNFKVIAAISAVAEHSIMHQYAAGRPDRQDKRQLQDFAKKIYEKITDTAACDIPLNLPGNRPYKKTGGSSLIPKADAKCTHCGICADRCPAEAIDRNNLKVSDSKKCISCMRCIAECPSSARKVNSAMVAAAAFAMKKACSERKENELFI